MQQVSVVLVVVAVSVFILGKDKDIGKRLGEASCDTCRATAL